MTSPESKIQLDSQGIPINIVPYERRTSNKLIEEFMLLANETIAEHYYWLKYPFVTGYMRSQTWKRF